MIYLFRQSQFPFRRFQILNRILVRLLQCHKLQESMISCQKNHLVNHISFHKRKLTIWFPICIYQNTSRTSSVMLQGIEFNKQGYQNFILQKQNKDIMKHFIQKNPVVCSCCVTEGSMECSSLCISHSANNSWLLIDS